MNNRFMKNVILRRYDRYIIIYFNNLHVEITF